MSPSTSFLQPSPFTPDQFTITPPQTPEANNTSCPSEGFIKKRPIQITEELIAGRALFYPSRPRPSPVKTPLRRLRVEELPGPTRSVDSSSLDIITNPVTPPSKYPFRIPTRAHDVSLPPRPKEFICYSPAVRRHAKKTRSLNSRRMCTPSSSIKSPSLDLARSIRSRPPLARWSTPSVSTCDFYTPESTHYPITPPSNAASVMIATNCPWTISSSSSSPYSP